MIHRELNLDEPQDIRTVFTSWTGITIAVISALVSTLASALVILLICISQKKLARSVYHRILFGMSVADIIQSLGMAITTLPMPTDMIYTGFQGFVIGNQFTCKAQGSSIAFGATWGMMYNAMLAIYYVCSIQKNMTDEAFRRCLEPTLHAIVIVIPLIITTLILSGDMINPSPTALTWCGVATYPYWSQATDDKSGGAIALKLSFLILIVCFATIVVSMIMIVRKVRQRDRERLEEISSSGNLSRTTRIIEKSKIIRNQAMAYSIVNLFGFIVMAVLPFTRNMSNNGIPAPGWQVTFLVFRPLQGLFNSCIFVYHKAYSLQREYTGLSMIGALAAAIRGDETEERAFSNLVEVRRQSALYQVRFANDDSKQNDKSSLTFSGEGRSKQNNDSSTNDERNKSAVVSSHINLESVIDSEANLGNLSGLGASIGDLSGFEGSVGDLSGFEGSVGDLSGFEGSVEDLSGSQLEEPTSDCEKEP